MGSLKELEDEYGASTLVDIIGFEEIDDKPHEVLLSLGLLRAVDPVLPAYRLGRDVAHPVPWTQVCLTRRA